MWVIFVVNVGRKKHIDIVSEVAWLPAPAIELNEEKSAFDVHLQPANCMQRGGALFSHKDWVTMS